MEIKPEFKKKPIRSFVIRSGRMTDGQRAAFNQWWPQFGLRMENGVFDAEQTFNNQNPTVVEVGFGMGDSLIEMARAETDKNFVGIEVHPPGVGRIISQAGENELRNLKVFMADATDVLSDCFSDGSLHRFQLYFPDPWHKKKHHKRRIVQTEFVRLITQKLAPGGVLHMATDWQPYAEHMLAVLSAEPQLINTVEDFSPRPSFRPLTKFEKRGERLGHGVWDLLFTKTSS